MTLITVLVPTYRRPTDLLRCLDALTAQTRQPDEIIVVVRDTDADTFDVLSSRQADPRLQIVTVCEPGVVAAMNLGLSVAAGDIVALTDDDSVPHYDWLTRIEAHFASEERIGGVGGRDIVYMDGRMEGGASPVVGVLQWFGRAIGGHHTGIGPARNVDFLKGVNCAYRADLLRSIGFDRRLLGAGAQVHWELALGLTVRRAGFRLIYDPEVIVDHFPSVRHDADRRGDLDGEALFNAVHNETLAIWEHLSGFRKLAFAFWAFGVGSKVAPGVVCALCATISNQSFAYSRFFVTVKARATAMRSSKATPLPSQFKRD